MERNETKTNDYSNHYGSIMDVLRRKKASSESVEEATEHLITSIKESSIYMEYETARDEIFKYPQLKERVDEYRKSNYSLQNDRTVDIFEEAEKLQYENRELLENALVRQYLNAENAFCRLIQQINWQLIEELDFEADFEGKTVREA